MCRELAMAERYRKAQLTPVIFGVVFALAVSVQGQVAEDMTPPACGGRIKEFTLSGYLASPTVPGRGIYYPNQLCQWDIPRKPGYRINLKIIRFDLEEQDFIGVCRDYVSLNNEKICGVLPGGKQYGPYPSGISVRFITDNRSMRKGFNISFVQEKIPICIPPCANGGTCTKDDECSCNNKGFTGYRCMYTEVARGSMIRNYARGNVQPRDSCAIYGQKNIRTFDGKMFSIPTSCEYAVLEYGNAKVAVAMSKSQTRGTAAIEKVVISRGIQKVIISKDASRKMFPKTGSNRRLERYDFYGPFELVESYSKIRVKDEDFVVEVDEDSTAMTIIVQKYLMGKVRGLCGNYNGNITDDMKAASGNLAKDSEMLSLAWNLDKSCTATTQNVVLTGRARDAKGVCNHLKSSSFSGCLNKLPVESYYSACLNDMRLCNFDERPECHCATLSQYARDCAREKLTTSLQWRDELCEKKCPSNQIYSECAPYSPRTCKSLGTVARCKDICTDGCTCPKDLYWDGKTCVSKESCSCHVGDVVYSKGEKLNENCRTCVCENGTLKCETKTCDGTGLAFGNPHYLTFDGMWYSYDGVCSYTLLRGPMPEAVRMVITTNNCGPESAFTCINRIEISSEVSPTVQLQLDNVISVDGQRIDLPYVKKNKLEIVRLTSLYISIYLIPLKIRVKWNKFGIAIINVPNSLKGKIGGLLGNFNGKTTDEFLTPSGIIERTPSSFTESWEAQASCKRPKLSETDNCKLSDADRKACHDGIYHNDAFRNCIAVSSDEEPIKRICQESTCSASSTLDKNQEMCNSLSIFAMLCALKGHVANWRNETFCSMNCDSGKIYESWTSTCGRTCRGVTENETCTQSSPKAEGCVCPQGMYENKDGKCVQKKFCECFYDGEWRKNGEFFVHDQRDCDCVRGVVSCSKKKNFECGTELVYKSCIDGDTGAKCQPTCANKKPRSCGNCVPGCGCPVGKFMHGGKCYKEKECPCTFEGKDYFNDQYVVDDCDYCTCIYGKWSCKKTNMCTRTCSVTSGSYYKTFDEGRFHSRGTCKYILMTDKCPGSPDNVNYFEVYAQSHPCKDSGLKMCNLTVNAQFGNDVFVLARGQDIVDKRSGINDRNFYDILPRKMRVGFYQVVEADFFSYYIQLRYDMKTSLTIEVSRNISIRHSRFGRKLCGLCGDLDGSSWNDFTTKYGHSDPASFINEWRYDTCAEVPKEEMSACQGKPVQEDNAKRQCKIIMGALFSECHKKIDPKPFYDTCIEETCSCETGGQCECYCSAVSAYAESCGRRGAKSNWRLVTGCPVECEEFTSPDASLCDIKYDPCQPCVKTCCSMCARGCFEGCFPRCKKGLVFNPTNQTCIPESECICPKAPTVIEARPSTPAVTGTTTTAPTKTRPFTTRSQTTAIFGVTKPCENYCTNSTGGKKDVGEKWVEDCMTVTCNEDRYGCGNKTTSPLICESLSPCKSYEMQVQKETDSCGCETFICQCDKCFYQGKMYNITEKWKDGDCIEKECTVEACPTAVTKTDRRTTCPNVSSVVCEKYYSQVSDNSDPCCPKNRCKCDTNLCPKKPDCLAGTKIDHELTNECCTVHKCQPVCIYNGKEHRNGSEITRDRCFNEYCRCTDDRCSVNKEDEVTCSDKFAVCINDDTHHFPPVRSPDGCCIEKKCNCECKVYGSQYYHTFDGSRYDFDGICQYTFVKYRDSNDLHIIGENHGCSSGLKAATCLKHVIVKWKGTRIRISVDKKIQVNGSTVRLTWRQKRISREITMIKRCSGAILVKIKPILLTLTVRVVNGVVNMDIGVPMSRIYNETVGLCGTCSNNRTDDFETSYGNKTDDTSTFGQSWLHNKTADNCRPCWKSDSPECSACDKFNTTDDKPERCKKCPDKDPCSEFHDEIFKPCTVKPKKYKNSCQSDQNRDRKCSVCSTSSFIEYAENCGACVKWRSKFNCTPECPKNQIYKECVTLCELRKTCASRSAPGRCPTADESGCGCPDGMVFEDNENGRCIEDKCCDCKLPKCAEYEELVTVSAKSSDCCGNKVCRCKKPRNITCTGLKVPTTTDHGTPGCNHTECICPLDPVCPATTTICDTPGCNLTTEVEECGCAVNVSCKCDKTMCPPLPKCKKCETLEESYPEENPVLACGGNCCAIGKCVRQKCSPDYLPPRNFTMSCPFLQDEGVIYDLNDKDKCCPKSYKSKCIKEKCDVIERITSCSPGYELRDTKVNESADATIRSYASCPDVDKCCYYRECVCKSCTYAGGRLLLGEERFDRCDRLNCEMGVRGADGCFEVARQNPVCSEPPVCECYQTLVKTQPVGGATKLEEWLSLCCPTYKCADLPCGAAYKPGPASCSFPAKRIINYMKMDGCVNPKCPMASCECNHCVDLQNKTISIGTVIQGDDKCENYTCIKDAGQKCPYLKPERIQCVPLSCADDYEDRKTEQNPDGCCPSETCLCKPENMLKEVCPGYKNDTSMCADPKNMMLEPSEKYIRHKCCPEKKCVCKPEAQRSCEVKECRENYDLVKTKNASKTECCAQYDCVCNCKKKKCKYSSWVVKNGGDGCKCECVCDQTLCDLRKPNCQNGETLMLTGTKDDGCCQVFECVCNTSQCTPPPSANCNLLQIEYPWKESKDDCCPSKNKCKCNPDSTELEKLCNQTRHTSPHNCTEGWEPYVARIMASEDDTMCCDTQCRCVSCQTEEGLIKQVGAAWEETKNCKILQHRCSEEVLTNGCHKIITSETAVPCEYKSLGDYQQRNCKADTFAVQTLPLAGCCPNYRCEPCAATNISCNSYAETRITNASNPRCPGQCICSSPLTETQSQYCLSRAICGEFEVAAPLGPTEIGKKHSDKCCMDYKCICGSCPSTTVSQRDLKPNADLCEKVGVRPSDADRRCCKNYEIQCKQSCSCKRIDLNCSATESSCLERTVSTNLCNCPSKLECACHSQNCPVINCGDCEILQTAARPTNALLPCGGNCCPTQTCVRKTCPAVKSIQIPKECTFLKKKDIFDSGKCCPTAKDLECNTDPSACPYQSPESCEPGYELKSILANNSMDLLVKAVQNCPMVDKCCPHRKCVCRSCPYSGGRLNLGDHPVFSANGCVKYTCNQENHLQDGCYNVTVQKPDCAPPPYKKCFQRLVTQPPPGGAAGEAQWHEFCCNKYTINDIPCNTDYNPGPASCEYPAVREVSYETVDGCKKENCPIAKCKCLSCLDENNDTYDIGSQFNSVDNCNTFTCLEDASAACAVLPQHRQRCGRRRFTRKECLVRKCCFDRTKSGRQRCYRKKRIERGDVCPKPVKLPDNCPNLRCNQRYEYLDEISIEGQCCPNRTCFCKREEMLKEICKDYRNDTSSCADPDNMLLVPNGKFSGHRCCPEMNCVCKEESQRRCPTKVCRGKFNKLEKIANASETRCCAEYQCTCDCSKKRCPYSSWTPKRDNTCTCECICDESKCNTKKPVCSDGEELVEISRTDNNCCPVYECVCNTTNCPLLPSANCSVYQMEYDWKDSSTKCCPVEKRCKCNPDSVELKRLCNETMRGQPENCVDGYEPYVAKVMAGSETGLCCENQCRCVSCFTGTGEVKKVGSEWSEMKNCRKFTHRCSDKLRPNGCHKIISTEEDVTCPYQSIGDFENKNCGTSQYAVRNRTEDCCAIYNCVPCENSQWSCDNLTETRQADENHPRCPGKCVCDYPMTNELTKFCFGNAKCEDNEKAVAVRPGKIGITHSDKCCPNYECICATCPAGTVTAGQLSANSSLCEVIVVRPSDATKRCCRNFMIECDRNNCTCPSLDLNCEETDGCIPVLTKHSKCGCAVTGNCQCKEQLCPKIKCGKCEQMRKTDLPFNPASKCGGNCCPNITCEPKPCPIIPDTIIEPECTFVKQICVTTI